VLVRHLDSPGGPVAELVDHESEVSAGGGEVIGRTAAWLTSVVTTPARVSSPRRWTSTDRDIVGTPRAMALKVSAPIERLRTTSSDPVSPRISVALAIGRYWR
jgi:hypothetical protein